MLTLGRNSDVVINEEVYDQEPSEDFAAATSEVEDIQKALEQGEFDPTTELEATAAGPLGSIICWYLDNKNKRTRWLGEIVPGDDKMKDLIRIRDLYEKAGYRFPLHATDISIRFEEDPPRHPSQK